MSTIQLQLPDRVRDAVESMAARDGVPAEQLMVIAIAEMVAEQRAMQKASDPRVQAARARLLDLLAKVPARKPMKGDEVPASLRKRLEKKFPALKHLARK